MSFNQLVTDPEALKASFKSVQTELKTERKVWAIRVHRAISWYGKAMNIAGSPELVKEMDEARLLFLWISLSALFSQWDPEEHRPAQESSSLTSYVDQLIGMDSERVIIDCLGQRKATIRRLVSNPALHAEFWVNPFSSALPERLARADRYFDRPLNSTSASMVLKDSLYRVYMLRSQIVHGSSTSGSKFNRQTLSDSIQFLQALVPAVISVAVNSGSAADWPPLCYPPVDVKNPEHLRGLVDR